MSSFNDRPRSGTEKLFFVVVWRKGLSNAGKIHLYELTTLQSADANAVEDWYSSFNPLTEAFVGILKRKGSMTFVEHWSFDNLSNTVEQRNC